MQEEKISISEHQPKALHIDLKVVAILLFIVAIITAALIYLIPNFIIPSLILFQAEKAFQAKEYAKAVSLHEQILNNYPSFIKEKTKVHYRLGISYLFTNKIYRASASFSRFLDNKPSEKELTPQVRYLLGLTFNDTQKYYQAIQQLEKVSLVGSGQKIEPASYYSVLAEAYLGKNKFDKAIIAADKVLELKDAKLPFTRKSHVIKFLAYQETRDVNNAKKEEQLLGSLGYDDLDLFESGFYTDRSLSKAQENGLLNTITNASYDAINQNKNLSPAKKAVVFTVLATFYRQNGKLTEAEFYAKKAIEADSDYLPGYYEMGSIYSSQGKFHTALGYDQKASKIDPNHPLVRTAIGWDYYNLAVTRGSEKGHIIGVMKQAEDNYLKALEEDPELAIAQNNLGLVYFERNQCNKATGRFNLAIKYDPTYPKPINNLGAVYYEAQDYSTAIDYFKKSLEIDPNYARAYLNIGREYYLMGDFQKSLLALQKDLTLDPYDTDAYLWIANNYLAQGKFKASIETLNKAIAITPDYPKLYFALSDAYHENGDGQKERESFEKAMSFFLIADTASSANAGETYASSEYIYYFNRGIEYKRDGKIEQAIEAYKKAIELQPGYTDSYFNLSRIYESKYGKDKSIELLRQGIKEAPDSLLLYDELGYIYKDSGDLDNASKIFQEAITKVQGNCDKANVARIFEGLGLIYYANKKFDLALDTFNKALEQNPRSSTIYTNIGATYTAKGDSKKALTSLETALQLNPKDAVAHNNLGDILAQQGRINEAILEFNKALEIDPNLKIAQENLARFQKKSN